MKWGAWAWGMICLVVSIASASGWLVCVSPILVSVPAGLFALGAGSFCFGRPGLLTPERVAACVFAALVSVMAGTHLPLRAGFSGARGGLDYVAAEASVGRFKPGTKAGWFSLQKCDVDPDGNIYLWTGKMPGGRFGFVKSGVPKIQAATEEVDLGSGWHYVFVRGVFLE